MKMSTSISDAKQPTLRSSNGRSHSAGVPEVDDADARYAVALRLVQAIDRDLQQGTRHYYDASGKLLVSLDEVVQAILNDTLVVDKSPQFLPEEGMMNWSAVGEIIA
ncbi:MAG: hypothetical protein RMK79_09175 [Anaerolineae bacterium]|nr:hypothetical protein [Anaerolineae bacterium]